jgi:ubiquinone/menaquinone biosynthesis C-methylase UbiE
MINILNKKFLQFFANKLGYQISKYPKGNSSKSSFGLNNQKNRENWLKNKLLEIPSGFRILDAGAGELQYKKFCTHLNYVSQDFGQYYGGGNNEGLQMQSWDNSKLDIVCDITKIPEHDSSFDAIMCIEVLEHIPEPIEAIKEFSRLLKQGGTLIITAPFCSLTHFAPYHYYSGFNKYFYEKHLTEYGFIIEEIISNGSYFEYLAQEIQVRIPNSYSSEEVTELEKNSLIITLQMLEKMNKSDKGSSELLCFGYHIKAHKK